MILVIFAMRSAQNTTERAIQKGGKTLRMLEDNPSPALEFLKKQQIEKPITLKEITASRLVGHLNLCALIAFVIGVLCLATFTAYNLWRTPDAAKQSQHAGAGIVLRSM
jgi:hypothetical protein